MKQVLQSLRTGEIEVVDLPAPTLRAGHIIVLTTHSVISPGTERMLRDFGRSNIVGKILQQPQRVREVLQKARTDGIATTLEAVQAKLDQPMPVGYCNVGRVIAAAPDVSGFAVGDRVISNGPHAQIVRVPVNLAVRIPDTVSDDQAAFTVLGAIALQGLRLISPTLGECIAVTGLGLIGLLAVQLLRAQGVRVLGIDVDAERCALARQFGAETVCIGEDEDPLAHASQFSRGRGLDAVLICAATKSNDPIEQAAKMARQRGRIVLVGVVGLAIPRDEFYRKELTFQVSCSYGPGRYDPDYEEKGQDYPIGHVRWTEQRNFEAVLDEMADDRLDVSAFISRRFPIEKAAEGYASLDEGGGVLGIMLDYPESADTKVVNQLFVAPAAAARARPGVRQDRIRVGMIGAGNYASRQLVPALKKAGVQLTAICGGGGASSTYVGRKFGFDRICPDIESVLSADDVDLVVIATRHDSHAALVARALGAGRAVFVEKPLAMTDEEVAQVAQAYEHASQSFVMVGFNRRFAPHVVRIRKALERMVVPPVISMTVNAGAIPFEHWTQNRSEGGGRIIGEGCHFIDLARHLAGAPITQVQAASLGRSAADSNPEDKAVIVLSFENGAVASIQYLANGHKSYPKERVEVFCGGKIWRIENFRRLEGFGTSGERGELLGGQNKGQAAMAQALIAALQNGAAAPIPFGELIEVAERTIEADRILRGI